MKEYKINSSGCCINPDELFNQQIGKYYIRITLACKGNSWTFGFSGGGPMQSVGGFGFAPCFNKYRKDRIKKTREETEIEALDFAISWGYEQRQKGPPDWADLQKIINSLTKLKSEKMAKTTKQAAPAAAAEMRFIKIKDIVPDPNQPRKHFNELEDKELLESIRIKGILQPILLRPIDSSEYFVYSVGVDKKPAPFLIVCGERRFRAAKMILEADPGWMEGNIPAIIRLMNDEEAREAQIVENLQRKDVHPMEEALAFKYLADKGLTQEQIGARIGKGDRFVRARLVLCGLTKAWQDIFSSHVIDLETALMVCRHTEAVQKQILSDYGVTKEKLKDPGYRLHIKSLKEYNGDLLSASFDLSDATLNKKAGACIGCSFNSATAVLFSEDEQKPRCLNLTCYTGKINTNLERLIAKAKEDPEIILVKEGYRAEDDPFTESLKKDGLAVYGEDRFDNVNSYQEDPGSYENWKYLDYNYSGANYDPDETEEENRETWEQEVKDWENHKKKISSGLKSGKYKKAVVVQGKENAKGTEIVIELKTPSPGRSEGPTPAQKIAEWVATPGDIDMEIERLKEDIQNATKKAKDNAHIAIVKAYKESALTKSITDLSLSPAERACLAFYLLEEMGELEELWSEDVWFEDEEQDKLRVFAQSLGVNVVRNDKKRGGWELSGQIGELDTDEGRQKIFEFLLSLTEEKLALIFRRVIAQKYGQVSNMIPSGYDSSKAWILRKMAETFNLSFGINIEEIEKEANDKATKRISRAEARITELRSKKKELTTSKKEKPAKKKGGGKSIKNLISDSE